MHSVFTAIWKRASVVLSTLRWRSILLSMHASTDWMLLCTKHSLTQNQSDKADAINLAGLGPGPPEAVRQTEQERSRVRAMIPSCAGVPSFFGLLLSAA